MNSRKSKELRRRAVGDPDYTGRIFADAGNQTTWMNHPASTRAQYKALKRAKRGK